MPTLEDFEPIQVGKLEVYTNGSGEVFVKNISSGVTIRVGDYGENLQVTAAQFRLSPTDVNGLDAFRVSKH